ncbi:5-methyltetrahydropteroyltriglutamate--homocysteine S-methyltransferase [Syntrophotalea carbinolica DSM 2380]|uniref:5-methyltetrahydropteroyltriglutamate--homocysteine methyltransferase n=1 Tax=Syntrophotalea carbinolica (strain DSM 2380 / NBRC 103641 / GraBd1) TaxID=338963 RepID=METE_SYNC1|nr:5-methyltetrahydropteroyltriglutamate--homocysteine S-methyltransferase [Syntrophotalea carbinolica]Q3A7E2.1 RecName: Full=5-methyltetrahydropteroyltriglutamate--homocysteine methyltransferase; AltName: Full=Cobalamin-independent methionine synthase; AltName: Full=Methionine synthase, vitamin-B12 independent isozyme [Syntrophotalea carbinolica DSM 2380]ABA87702.1 5-methyltetrahydropteroyltriglutamate--homocysteine S-methyltransferase [Syntrophotalea carbinolica DSM 2380]
MLTHTLGFPRMGAHRELKKNLESYWKGAIGQEKLMASGRELRLRHWRLQQQAGIDLVPVGDFSYYDHMLDMVAMLGAVPPRFGWQGESVDLDTYFYMARGSSGHRTTTAMEMTKWFDTNYHYIVPEFYPGQRFRLARNRLFEELAEACIEGIQAKPVLPGPMTFIALGKEMVAGFDRWSHLDAVVEVYEEIVSRVAAKCSWIQLDEPILATDVPGPIRLRVRDVYRRLAAVAGPCRLMVATYFGALQENLDLALSLPVDGLHVDLVRAPGQLEKVLPCLPENMVLSLGLIDGRNVWRSNLRQAISTAQDAVVARGSDRVMIAPSCSLLHVPVDLAGEAVLDPRIRSWLAFARQKCQEVNVVRLALDGEDVTEVLQANDTAMENRRKSALVHRDAVRRRMADISPDMYCRRSSFEERKKQQAWLRLPTLPTTTIGSFPQVAGVRSARRSFKQGRISEEQYRAEMQRYIREAIAQQEALGLDVLVHGEPERNDMVEYFGEQLAGFCFTENGWVQGYGSRCVKPPIIYGDVERLKPMTMEWTTYAQQQTNRPLKGMLTGPVTMLCWSFVRDDQPRSATCKQIALAIRDEVQDLEQAGIKIIQVDEAALREGLPLRKSAWREYLGWAVDAFRLTASGVADSTQIHTHMCYSEFNHIAEWIAKMDADVISIEASRSNMELLGVLESFTYPNDIGPGVYDIHSPRVPSVAEMVELLRKASEVIPLERLWVNPDCGLKTRAWPETLASLRNMVAAAQKLRFFARG